MRLTFSCTFDDYREANRAHARARKPRWFVITLFTIMGLGVTGLMLMCCSIVISALLGAGQSRWENIRPIMSWLLIAGALLIYGPIASSLLAVRRAWRGQPALQLQQTMELDEQGVTLDDKQSRNEFTWEAFLQLIETRNLFLLFPSKLTFIMIPKRAVPPSELELLNAGGMAARLMTVQAPRPRRRFVMGGSLPCASAR